MNCAVHRTESMHANFMGWIRLIGFIFNGEPYEYVFEAGRGDLSERAARENSNMLLHRQRAEMNFLRDVPLNMEMPN